MEKKRELPSSVSLTDTHQTATMARTGLCQSQEPEDSPRSATQMTGSQALVLSSAALPGMLASSWIGLEVGQLELELPPCGMLAAVR